jgi:ATP synthase subunit 6
VGKIGRRRRHNRSNTHLLRDITFGFVFDIIKENLNPKGVFFFPVIYLAFLSLVIGNLTGMVPYAFTSTSSAIISFSFSVTFFLGATYVSYRTHKDVFFQGWLPAGVPLPLSPFLIVVEGVSYSAKVFSLGVRLFANMLAGHGLIKILGSFVCLSIGHSAVSTVFYIFPLAIIFFIAFLELAVAFLQAYVFIVLVSLYLNDAISIH